MNTVLLLGADTFYKSISHPPKTPHSCPRGVLLLCGGELTGSQGLLPPALHLSTAVLGQGKQEPLELLSAAADVNQRAQRAQPGRKLAGHPLVVMETHYLEGSFS